MLFDHSFLTLLMYRNKLEENVKFIDLFLLGGEPSIYI